MNPGARTQRRVVVVGAGPGGIAAARHLAEHGRGRVEVMLVTRGGRAEHHAGTPAVALGERPVEHFAAPVRIDGVKCVAGDAGDATGSGVSVDGTHVAADAVIAAPGLEVALEEAQAMAGVRAMWDLTSADSVSRDLVAVPGGRVVIGVCGLPYRCPPAPFSLAMRLLDSYRRDGRFTKVVVTTPEPIPLARVGGEAPGFLLEACHGSGVEVELGFEIDGERSERGVLRSCDGRQIDYELALLVPRHRRPALLSGLPGTAPTVEVGAHGQTAVANLFVAGDAAATPLPRAAGVAEAQGRTAAGAVLAGLGVADAAPPEVPSPSCYVGHGGGNTSRIRIRYPLGVPASGEGEVSIDGPTPELALAAEAERRRFMALVQAGAGV